MSIPDSQFITNFIEYSKKLDDAYKRNASSNFMIVPKEIGDKINNQLEKLKKENGNNK